MIVRRVEQYGPWLAGLAVALSLILFALAGVYTFRQQEHVNDRLCQGTVANRAAVRATWEAARKVVLEGQETKAQKQASNRFFNRILDAIPPLYCANANPRPIEG